VASGNAELKGRMSSAMAWDLGHSARPCEPFP
jgi:hypothetical protein